MHIVNLMLGRGRGGIEQASIDMSEGLQQAGHQSTVILRPGAAICPDLESLNIPLYELPHWGAWDPFAPGRLRRILQSINATAVIAHGNRAITIGSKATRNLCPLVAVAHNYSLNHIISADAAFAITRDIANHIAEKGMPRDRIFEIPNMVRPHNTSCPARRNPPVIGTMGRMVKKKGFEDFLKSLALLKERGVAFNALLGGSGEEESALKAKASALSLNDVLTFTGWIEDKQQFFNQLDIFVLPSLHEPFGIVLLEAYAAHLPVITTNSEGPSAIAMTGEDALIVPKANPTALAEAVETLIKDETLAKNLAEKGYAKVQAQYAMPVVTKRIVAALETITSQTPSKQYG